MEFRIDETLREKVISEYAEKELEKDEAYARKGGLIILAAVILIFGALFAIMAMPYIAKGKAAEGFNEWGMAMKPLGLILILSLPMFYFWIKNSKERIKKELTEDLGKISYSIEDGCLVRYYEGDKRRTKRFDIRKISHLHKVESLVTFDYKGEEIEIPDYYEPSLYETLKGLKEKKV